MASNSRGKQSPLVALKELAMKNVAYPTALATYEEVVANRALFMETLKEFHASMRTKFMIPTIGGRELDLHQLFVVVTSRGGIDKVVGEKRWKEVTAVFNFPSSATNASFVLRRYYYTLLYNYEQLYYFKAKGGNLGSPASSHTPLAVESPAQVTVQPSPEYEAATFKRHRTNTVESLEASPGLSTSSQVVGVIDGKFENGYLVTVTIGTKRLKGVLYEAPHEQSHQASQPNVPITSIASAPAALGTQRRRRRKKCEIKRRDPDHPKPNRSGYNFFFAEQHARLKPLHPGKDREISKMIGELWNKIDETQRAVYQEKARIDKERYRKEMEDYRERKKIGGVVCNAIPLQQGPTEQDSSMTQAGIPIEETGLDSSKSLDNASGSDESDFEDEDDKTTQKNLDMEEASPTVGLNADLSTADFERCGNNEGERSENLAAN